MQGDWNTKVGKDAHENCLGICGPFCSDATDERGLGLMRLATFKDLVLKNTFGHHEVLRVGPGIAQTDNTIVRLITFNDEALSISSEHC